jgi:hypothetical protein
VHAPPAAAAVTSSAQLERPKLAAAARASGAPRAQSQPPQPQPQPLAPPARPALVTLHPLALAVDEQRLRHAHALMERQRAALAAQLAWLEAAAVSAALDPLGFVGAVRRTWVATQAAERLLLPAAAPMDAPALREHYAARRGGGQPSLLARLVDRLRLGDADSVLAQGVVPRETGGGGGASAAATAVTAAQGAAAAAAGDAGDDELDPITGGAFLALPYRMALCPLPITAVDADAYRLAVLLVEREVERGGRAC